MVVGYSFVGLYSTDPGYADILLAHARKLYDFGYDVRKKYTDSIPDAAQFYQYVSSLKLNSIFVALRRTRNGCGRGFSVPALQFVLPKQTTLVNAFK